MENKQQEESHSHHKSTCTVRCHSDSHKKCTHKLNKVKRRHTHYEEFADDDSDNESISILKEDLQLKEVTSSWTKQEEAALIEQFNELGGNWKKISNTLSSRRQDQVKKHFLKITRKVTENIKFFILGHFQHGCKHINHRQIRGLVEETVELDIKQENNTFPLYKRSKEMMRQILQQFSHTASESSDCYRKQIIQSLQSLILDLKRLRKQKHIINGETAVPSVKSETEFIKIERGYQSDSSSAFEEPIKDIEAQPLPHCNYENDYDDEQSEKNQQNQEEQGKSVTVVVVEEESRIKLLLKESGVLQFQPPPVLLSANRLGTAADSIHSNSQNLNNQSYQHFYEESELQRECYWKKNCNFGGEE